MIHSRKYYSWLNSMSIFYLVCSKMYEQLLSIATYELLSRMTNEQLSRANRYICLIIEQTGIYEQSIQWRWYNDMPLMITWSAYCWQDQPSYQSYDLLNSILMYWSYRKDPYCILLLSVMPVDATQKKDDEIRLIGNWDSFQKVFLAGHNAGRVIINESHLPYFGAFVQIDASFSSFIFSHFGAYG